jgi:choline dehydrogenase-like flavoprotein
LPVARVTHRWDANDLKLMEAATRQAVAMLEAAGAVDTLLSPAIGAHLTGTCRMGMDPSRSVVNALGQTHDIPNLFIADGSIFVTGGSVNNTLTSVAVSMHVADSMLTLARQGEL